MKEELTTAMHSEFMSDEIAPRDLDILGVYGAMGRGLSKKEALKKYNMTAEEYNANIQRVLNS